MQDEKIPGESLYHGLNYFFQFPHNTKLFYGD